MAAAVEEAAHILELDRPEFLRRVLEEKNRKSGK
jgi:hypothetical protein